MQLITKEQKQSFQNNIEKIICERENCDLKRNSLYWATLLVRGFLENREKNKFKCSFAKGDSNSSPTIVGFKEFPGHRMCCHCDYNECHCIQSRSLQNISEILRKKAQPHVENSRSNLGKEISFSLFIQGFVLNLLRQHKSCALSDSIQKWKPNWSFRPLECDSLRVDGNSNFYYYCMICHCKNERCGCKIDKQTKTINHDNSYFIILDIRDQDSDMFQKFLSKIFMEEGNEMMCFPHNNRTLSGHRFQSKIFRLIHISEDATNNYYYIQCFCKLDQCPQIQFVFIETLESK